MKDHRTRRGVVGRGAAREKTEHKQTTNYPPTSGGGVTV